MNIFSEIWIGIPEHLYTASIV